MIRLLADEQLAGRHHISPRAVNSASEVLTRETRELAIEAWHVPPFDVYAGTETGGIAAECGHHHGMHLFEDLVIPEVVDDRYRPVPAGTTGDRLLVTVLTSRTLPLIRYELTDRVRLASHTCPCPLPFRLLDAVEGRTEDALRLARPDGRTVRIHPVVFHQVLDLVDCAGWQVRHPRHRRGRDHDGVVGILQCADPRTLVSASGPCYTLLACALVQAPPRTWKVPARLVRAREVLSRPAPYRPPPIQNEQQGE